MSELTISISVDSQDIEMTECGSTLEEAKAKMSIRILKKEKVTLEEIELLKTISAYSADEEDYKNLSSHRFTMPGTDNIRVLRQLPLMFRLPNYGDFYEVWKSYILFSDTQETDEFYYFEKVL